MSAEKSLAIVLRVVEFSETSCVVTLYTRDFGKIGALAKGARRPKSPFESALDLLAARRAAFPPETSDPRQPRGPVESARALLAVCRVVFLHKSSDALDLLTEARLERRFRAARRDL